MGPLLGNELPVPAKDGVGSDERSNFGEGLSADGLAADSKTATLIIGQPEWPATELLPEDSVLLSEVFDDCVLMAADPAGQGGNEDLRRLEHRRHPEIVACGPSIGQLSRTVRVAPSEPGSLPEDSR